MIKYQILDTENTRDFASSLIGMTFEGETEKEYINLHTCDGDLLFAIDEVKEVEENHTIKIYFADGDSLTTRITGTFDEIINHYRTNNESYFNSGSIEKQIKKIEFIESHLLDNAKTCKYLFIDWNETGLLS